MSEINNRRPARDTKRPSARQTSQKQPQSRGGSGRSSSSSRSSSSRQSSADRILAVQNARNLGGGNSRGSKGSGNRNRNRRRRQNPDFAKIILIAIGVIIFIICMAVGIRSCSKKEGDEKESQESLTSAPESELSAEITVNGVSLTGLTKTEAREQVLESIGWDMQVSFDGDTKQLANLLESKVDAVLETAYSGQEAKDYTVETTGLESHVKTLVDNMAASWDVKPKNGSISSYDKAAGEFKFSGAENGRMIDRDKLTDDILRAVAAGDYKKNVTATAGEVEPEITEAEAKASFKRIGTFSTITTSNKDRNENIRLASEALNGIIIKPGEEFSMNDATGERSTAKGYKPAGAYLNGQLVEEPGGGVCQVSSTLYNAVVFSGLQTTARQAHSFEPSYVTPGEDAMISYGSADMKFRNNSKTAVGLKTSFSNNKLTISVYGSPILEEGVTLSMKSEKVKELDPPPPVYEEDPTMQLGVEEVVKEAVYGSRWVTNLVTKKNGEVISDTFLHNSIYNGKAATIKRNTSGSVLTTEGESTSAVEGSSPDESVTPTAPSSPFESENGIGGPGFEGPGFEPGTEPVGPNEEPGSNILPSGGSLQGPAGEESRPAGPPAMNPGLSPPVVTMPQTQPHSEAETSFTPGNNSVIPPIAG